MRIEFEVTGPTLYEGRSVLLPPLKALTSMSRARRAGLTVSNIHLRLNGKRS